MKFTQTIAIAALVGNISATDNTFKCEIEKIEYFKDAKCETATDDATLKDAAKGLKAYNDKIKTWKSTCDAVKDD